MKIITWRGLLGAAKIFVPVFLLIIFRPWFSKFGPFPHWVNQAIAETGHALIVTLICIFISIYIYKRRSVNRSNRRYPAALIFSFLTLAWGIYTAYHTMILAIDSQNLFSRSGGIIKKGSVISQYTYDTGYRGYNKSYTTYTLNDGSQYTSRAHHIATDPKKEYYMLVMPRSRILLNIVDTNNPKELLFQ